MRKLVIRGASAVVLAGATLFGISSPAFAGPKPSCVSVDVLSFNHVIMHNGCSTTQHLKVVWSHARDSGCFGVAPGASKDVNAYNQPFAAYDKVVTC
jgi:hypothetical protein